MKKKLILMGIAGALVLGTMIGGTLAAFQANSSQGTSEITTKNLDICIKDGDKKELEKYSSGVLKAMPGSTMDEDLKITYAAAGNYDSYVRVTVYKAWGESDSSGNFNKYFDDTLDLSAIQIQAADGWIVTGENDLDDETIVMYYQKPLTEQSPETTNFIDEIKISDELDNTYANKAFVIEASADAVQIAGGAEAIRSAWGVTAILDVDGNITGIDDGAEGSGNRDE